MQAASCEYRVTWVSGKAIQHATVNIFFYSNDMNSFYYVIVWYDDGNLTLRGSFGDDQVASSRSEG